MKHFKSLLTTLIFYSCACMMQAQTFVYQDLNYSVLSETDKTAVLQRTTFSEDSLVVPDYVTYDGQKYTVTAIGDYAFLNCETLKYVDLNKVTNISTGAFSGCYNLSSIDLSNVERIDDYAFENCRGLEYLVFDRIKHIGTDAFKFCFTLRVQAPAVAPTIGHAPFDRAVLFIPSGSRDDYKNKNWEFYATLCEYDFNLDDVYYRIDSFKYSTVAYLGSLKNATGDIVIPKTITYKNRTFFINGIGDAAFLFMSSIHHADLSNVMIIGKSAFEGCSNLYSVSTSNLQDIRDYAFSSCEFLSDIDLTHVTYLGTAAFEKCIFLKDIDLSNILVIGNSAFKYCQSLTNVNLKNVRQLGSSAFLGCSNLTTVSFGALTNISDLAFSHCSSLRSIDFTNVNAIGGSAFSTCLSLDTLDFKAVKSIGSGAFDECKSLEYVDFKEVTEIADYAFSQCDSLTAIDMPHVSSIGEAAFEYCPQLHVIKAPAQVPLLKVAPRKPFVSNPIVLIPSGSLDAYKNAPVWNSCTMLSAYDFNQGNTYYGIYSSEYKTVNIAGIFPKFDSKELTIPSHVTYDNKEYRITNIGHKAFQNCTTLTTLNTNQVTHIGYSAFQYCRNLETIEMPNLSMLGQDAFKQCPNIKTVKLGTAKPPLSLQAFDYKTFLDATLVVPTGTKPAYEKASDWSNFFITESDNPTGINPMPQAPLQSNIYDLNGRLVKPNASTTEGLHPGIYLMDGKKILVR